MSALILLGGGGHCRSVIDVIEQTGLYSILGVLEKKGVTRPNVVGYPLLGIDHDLPMFIKRNCAVVVTVGQIKTSEPREQVYLYAKEMGAKLPVVVSPRAYLSCHAKVGDGSTFMHGAIVNCNAEIGENCIINTRALVEHDAKIGSHTHIATGALINGGVQIGKRCFIGSGAVIHNDIDVGDGCLIGAGVTVQKDLPAGTVLKNRQVANGTAI
jgi:sugar O-acyltransferase (sialic acid O-acetyltransferase NeuD family)